MRRLFSLLPLLLPLPNLVQAADPVCTLENRVCAENNNSGKCIRYENTFTCVTVNPAGSRCTVDANPTLTDCTLSAPVCSAESGGICLETTTDFVCKSEPSGEGIRIDDTSVTVSYSKETKGEIPAGCIIGAEVCLDDDARDIEVENWDGHFVSANPACWVTERTILCPSVDGAASCQKLELAGCQKLTDPVCETEEHGVCVRWSSTYRCTRDEVIGDDIITDDVVTTPGDVHVAPQMPTPIDGTLRQFALRVPSVIDECSGIMVFGKRIKSLVFSTDLSIIRNVNADAVFAVYPFTPQPVITQALLMASDLPVFVGVGGGLTTGKRVVNLAMYAEMQGATGVVVNAPTPGRILNRIRSSVDVPVVVTVANSDTNYRHRIEDGAAIMNVAAGAQTPEIVAEIRERFPDYPIIATGGADEESIRATIRAGANAIVWTPPSSAELFRDVMKNYREGKPHP